MERINLKHLSALLGLSISTVSKALRDSHEISAVTKEKVFAAAKKYNYQPNPYAGSLRKAKSKTIAVVVPQLTNNFFIAAINAIQDEARASDYHVLIYVTHESSAYEKTLVNPLINGRVDGVIISLSVDTKDVSHLQNIKDKNIPIVFFDRVDNSLGCTTITTDDQEAAFCGTEHLLKKGCKRVACLNISNKISIGIKRLDGCRQALERNNLSVISKNVFTSTGDNEKDLVLIKKLLMSKPAPDGIFASIESLALNTYKAARQLKLSIGKDIKLICFSNLETAELLEPSLSTISQPAAEMGREAARHLIKQIEKPLKYKTENIVIKSRLVERQSTH